ncbi:MAG: transcriptional regulator [Bacteroidota bacterium]|nr:transcriptional regulator [Bacteroidota bacterium]
MTLEELLGNTRFLNERHKAIVGVLYVSNWIVKQQNVVYESEGLNAQKYNVLRILRGQYPHPASEKLIRERAIDKTSDMPRMLHWLTVNGFVERLRNARDKRIVDVVITEKAIKALIRLDAKQQELARCLKFITEDDARLMNEQLQKMMNGLAEEVPSPASEFHPI